MEHTVCDLIDIIARLLKVVYEIDSMDRRHLISEIGDTINAYESLETEIGGAKAEFDFNQAFGILDLGDESPEVLVRRLRDGSRK